MPATAASQPGQAAAVSRAPRRRRATSAGSVASRRSASTARCSSPCGTTSAFSPSRTYSSWPVTFEVTHVPPADIISSGGPNMPSTVLSFTSTSHER